MKKEKYHKIEVKISEESLSRIEKSLFCRGATGTPLQADGTFAYLIAKYIREGHPSITVQVRKEKEDG